MKIDLLIALYAPLLLVPLLIYINLSKKIKIKKIFRLSLFGLSFPIRKGVLINIGVIFFIIYYYYQYDFSNIFPTHFEMEVFYSPEKIKEILSIYSEDELKSRKIIIKDFELEQMKYFKKIDSSIIKTISNIKINDFFKSNISNIHSFGQADFIVKKNEGIHKYYLVNSIGYLSHQIDMPQYQSFVLHSKFEKFSTENDYIHPSIIDFFFNGIILMNCYKQSFQNSFDSSETKFDHKLFGLTKVTLFPYPSISNTIYLYDIDGIGKFPIGIAIYK